MITAEQIKQLSSAEKLQLMETLWQELTSEGADQLASPA
ncbi:addiction module protein [Rheinheimera baltica]|nr:addiction module protein [Rheinheimera baltica]MDP5191696.1 addiction module protein [Rheinheimera baltica]